MDVSFFFISVSIFSFFFFYYLENYNFFLFLTAYAIKSKRGRTMIVYKNYTYSRFPYPLKSGWRWYCSKVKSCRAHILTTENNVIITELGNHNHLPGCSPGHVPVPIESNQERKILYFAPDTMQ